MSAKHVQVSATASPPGGEPVVDSGTYTPTLTGVANVSASSAEPAQWSRIGNVVTVSGQASITPTLTATGTVIGISLPVASNFLPVNSCTGTGSAGTFTPGLAFVYGDAATGKAQFVFSSVGTLAHAAYFTFTYKIL